jgi:transposase
MRETQAIERAVSREELREQKRARVIELHRQGLSTEVVASRTGVSTSTVREIVKRAGLSMHGKVWGEP